MGFKITIKGIDQATAYLKTKDKETVSILKMQMVKIGLFMEGEVKQSVAGRKAEPSSVDTGRFLSSVSNRNTKDTATIFTDLEYPKFLEHGTSRISARKHFSNSLSRNRTKIRASIQTALKKL